MTLGDTTGFERANLVDRNSDSDGVLNPCGGIDPYSLALDAEGIGNILPALFSFLSSALISPDGKDATLTFGLLPIPINLKFGLEAKVKDSPARTVGIGRYHRRA